MAIKSPLTCLWVTLLAAGVTSAAMAAPAAPTSTPAASSAAGYSQPPKNILDVMRAPSPPMPVLSPTHDRMLLVSWQDYPSISRVAAPFLRLAGVRVEPKNHSKHDTPGGYGITPCASSFELVHVPDGAQTRIALPADACPGRPLWSADGKRFAFENITADSVDLWVGDASSGAIRRVPGAHLNPMLEDQLQWMPDQKTLLVKLVPARMGPPPPEPVIPAGPSIQESDGGKGQSSTYENRDTLGNQHDEDLFDYYAAAQLALVDAGSLAVTPVGAVGRYETVEAAPDGRHVLVSAIRKPYSYVTTFDRFPHQVEVWDLAKRPSIAVHQIASLPLADRVPIGGVALGPRDFTWRSTDPATLIWAEALDGGDWKVKVPARDKLMLSKAPFDAAPLEFTRTEQRYVGISWTEHPDLALLTDYDFNRHWRRSFLINVDDAQQKPRLLWDLSTDEKYANPGSPVRRLLPNGAAVLRQDGDAIFLSGAGASPRATVRSSTSST
ncbi:hypothetical protein [Collimonas pratensis]|uniref:hypothetical protein n=1 Tax=Collimonas pratensis TaxID=279113 RepID=UPI000AC005A0|nr:hypothetical protein [Collimonas pratensis]